jgi:predicted DNA-binding protein YlxM (UPF0122 family)
MYHTDLEIAKHCNVTRQAIQQLRVKWKIPARFNMFIKKRNLKMQALRNLGMSMDLIAKKFELSLTQAYRNMKSRNN